MRLDQMKEQIAGWKLIYIVYQCSYLMCSAEREPRWQPSISHNAFAAVGELKVRVVKSRTIPNLVAELDLCRELPIVFRVTGVESFFVILYVYDRGNNEEKQSFLFQYRLNRKLHDHSGVF